MIKEEIHCNDFWTLINYLVSISLVEETAAAVSSESMNGQIPPSIVPGAYPLVFNEPYGVILGMAPWNAPLILGLRAILAPLAAGNATIFKGSEFSPRVHYFIANLFRKVGFPPGVVNFILHTPEDAVSTFETLISNPIVKKANFTGSTAVGRSIAQTAGKYLKPVLLELGGKNISIVLEDADIERAAKETLDAAMMNVRKPPSFSPLSLLPPFLLQFLPSVLNLSLRPCELTPRQNGQVCMCTDTVLVLRPVAEKFATTLHTLLTTHPERDSHVIASKGRSNLDRLVSDAASKGAKVTQASGGRDTGNLFPLTLIENLSDDMAFNKIEAFGPLLGLRVVDSEEDILNAIHESGYGLSTSIFSKNHLRAINLGRKIDTGAVHINAGTVHDEGNFPHGGVGESGYGRFGSVHGMREFSRSKVIMIYPD